jgi:hypothetical protein
MAMGPVFLSQLQWQSLTGLGGSELAPRRTNPAFPVHMTNRILQAVLDLILVNE